MALIPDNLDRFHAHAAREEEKLDELPKCSECHHPIQDDRCYYFDGELICEECVENHRVFTEDFIE